MALKSFVLVSKSISKCLNLPLDSNLTFKIRSIAAGRLQSQYSTVSRKRSWNEIISEAEKAVAYGEMTIESQTQELGKDIQSAVSKLRSLVDRDSPLIEIAKNFESNSGETLQVRGLVVLLVAKMSSIQSINTSERDAFGLTSKQRILAQITEMIYAARLIHRTVRNLQPGVMPGDAVAESSKLDSNNKVAVLIGDYLLSCASFNLGNLRNSKVIEIMAAVLRNFSELEFMFPQDQQGSQYLTSATTIRDWEVRAYLGLASILANSCRSALSLSAEDEHLQVRAFELGKQLGLMWQLYDEVMLFSDEKRYKNSSTFDLMSIPMIIHAQSDPSILDEVLPHHYSLDTVNYEKLRSIIRNGTALQESAQIQRKYAQETLATLNQFCDSKSRTILQELVSYFGDC